MAQKFLHEVDVNGTRSAYKAVSDIPSAQMTNGASIRLWPGTYGPIAVDSDDVSYEGVGDKDEIIVDGGFTLTNASTGDMTVKNMTIKGIDPDAVGGAACISQLATDGSVNIKAREVVFANAELAVQSHGYGSVTLERVNGSGLTNEGVDKGVLSNSTSTPGITIAFSRLGANAHTNWGANADVSVTVVASTGGANTGGTTETVTALIS